MKLLGLLLAKFQSFFYWNCLGGSGSETLISSVMSRFNPSFTGIALVALMQSFQKNLVK